MIAATLCGLAGCASPAGNDSDLVARSPAALLVSRTEMLRRANATADQHPGGFVVVIDNDDMLPGYPRGTAVVIEPVNFSDLREGMTVLFHRRDGSGCCTHLLVLQTPDGWITRGTNAREDDLEPMTSANFVGRVVAAFTSDLPSTAFN